MRIAQESWEDIAKVCSQEHTRIFQNLSNGFLCFSYIFFFYFFLQITFEWSTLQTAWKFCVLNFRHMHKEALVGPHQDT